jgi:hypothetical protein
MPITRRAMMSGTAATLTAAKPARLRDVGWVWEGFTFDAGVAPTIFGVGQGAEFFGLKKAVWQFMPNNELALDYLKRLDEVLLHVLRYEYKHTRIVKPDGRKADALYLDVVTNGEAMLEETRAVARLAAKYPNVTGGFFDDVLLSIRDGKLTADQFHQMHRTLTANRRLKLWTVVYTHELDAARWEPLKQSVDVVNLWVWNANDLANLDRDLDRCREIFPGKPVNLGCYLRDYPGRRGVPMDLVKFQWERVVKYLDAGSISGYSILGTTLIDEHLEQARWIRDFIARH